MGDFDAAGWACYIGAMETPLVLPPVPETLLTALSEFLQRPEGVLSQVPPGNSPERQTLADALEYVAGAVMNGANLLACRRHRSIHPECELCFHAAQLHAVGFVLAQAANYAMPAYPSDNLPPEPERVSGLSGHERATLSSLRNGKIDCGRDAHREPCAHAEQRPGAGSCMLHRAAQKAAVRRLSKVFVPDC